MADREKAIKELILKNPNLSGNKIYEKSKAKGIGIRKSDFYKIFRKTKSLPEPSIAKREKSIPIKYRVVKLKVKAKPKVRIKPKIPFEKTKFGLIVKDLQDTHGISENKAIIHARKILKIDKSDYDEINQKDVQILLAHTP